MENIQPGQNQQMLEGNTAPLPPMRQPAPKKPKKKGIGLAALFIAGVVCAGALFSTGVALQNKIADVKTKNPQDLPPIYLKDPPEEEGTLSTTKLVAKVVPSVVSIDLYEEDSLEVAGSGSGIIFSEDGYIITNAHVVEDAYSIRVILDTGDAYTGTLVGEDPQNDLAVIKIPATGLTAAEFADSDKVQIGERAIAIGNAAGLFPGSPTQGIISGVNRELPMQTSTGETVSRTLLQTDAAINPGNSGGALVNMYGQVIGVNVAKLYSVEIDNIGFAIPSNVVSRVVESILQGNELPEQVLLGVIVLELNETNGPAQGLPSSGLYISEISPESDLANNDKVAPGDVIIGAAGKEVANLQDLDNVLKDMKPGDELELEIYRPETDDIVTVTAELYSPAKQKLS